MNADIVEVSVLLKAELVNNLKATEEMVMVKYLFFALVMNESLWHKLENDLLIGQDSYPINIGEATHLLTNWNKETS